MNSNKKNTLGIVGCIMGFLALSAAFLSPWLMGAIDPPEEPLEAQVVDFAAKLKEAAEAKMEGREYVGEEEEKKPSDYFIPGVMVFGLLGSGLGLGSLIKGEKRVIATAAMTLGISAVVVQWSIIIAAALLFVILVVSVLSHLGIDIPFP